MDWSKIFDVFQSPASRNATNPTVVTAAICKKIVPMFAPRFLFQLRANYLGALTD
jgi:hypothetical protein